MSLNCATSGPVFKCIRKTFGVLFRGNQCWKPFCSYSNLNEILLDMPLVQNDLRIIRQRNKLKGAKYVPGTVTLQVLGSGARGAPTAVYFFTDSSRYLFNCGEGSQRLAHEHKMKLSKLEHIFVTYPSWRNIGGLPGVALTIQDVGVPEITIHGPPSTEQIFEGTRRFVVLKNISIEMAECSPEKDFEDNVMFVKYVPIRYADMPGTSTAASECPEEFEEDHIDYYAHERSSESPAKIQNPQKDGTRNSRPEGRDRQAMSYICSMKTRPGMLNLEACVERRVPPGPLLGRLKKGEDIVLEDGTVVLSKDVTTPDDPGPVFIVVECPTEDHLDALLNEPAFHAHQSNASSPEQLAYLVVHFTPPHIFRHPRYKEWMARYAPATQHLVVNDDNTCMGSVAVHRVQQKLNLLHSGIFPLLKDKGIPVQEGVPTQSTSDPEQPEQSSDQGAAQSVHLTEPLQGSTFHTIHLRPRKGFNPTGQLMLTPDVYINETLQTKGFPEELEKLKTELNACVLSDSGQGEFPKIVFLGTGSCIPNKTRNTSGILVHTSPQDCVLLDCGEGTYGQIVRFYGREESEEVIRRLRAVYVSHLHADHHIGLVGLLSERRRILAAELVPRPLHLLAPRQILPWLHLCHRTFEDILPQFQIIPNGDLRMGMYKSTDSSVHAMEAALKMRDVSTVPVLHCPNSFGVAFTHLDGWKLTYSGDTTPCVDLIKLGAGSDVLIHEATMEDALSCEAQLKMHSTTSQAIGVGNEMKAKFILLSHFSQRYAKLPRLDHTFTGNVGIAFDNMQVSLRELPLLPKMYDALKLMFADHCEELEVKAFRRQLKKEWMERKRPASKSPTRVVKIAH